MLGGIGRHTCPSNVRDDAQALTAAYEQRRGMR